eukprot:UN29377
MKDLKKDTDLEAKHVQNFLLYLYGPAVQYCPEALSTCSRFFAQQSKKHNKAVHERLDETVMYDNRAQYDRLEKVLREYCVKHKAPRSAKKLESFLEKWFKDGQIVDGDEEELSTPDLDIFGQRNYLLMRGPEDAVIAGYEGFNDSSQEFNPLESFEKFPQRGEEIARCFWGPVRKHLYTDKKKEQIWLVSKEINLQKLQENKKSASKFNDDPPAEIATHRYLNKQFKEHPNTHHLETTCPYLVNMRGVTCDEGETKVLYYMDLGQDYFAYISDKIRRSTPKLEKNSYVEKK